jgi:hypothetical protein
MMARTLEIWTLALLTVRAASGDSLQVIDSTVRGHFTDCPFNLSVTAAADTAPPLGAVRTPVRPEGKKGRKRNREFAGPMEARRLAGMIPQDCLRTRQAPADCPTCGASGVTETLSYCGRYLMACTDPMDAPTYGCPRPMGAGRDHRRGAWR